MVGQGDATEKRGSGTVRCRAFVQAHGHTLALLWPAHDQEQGLRGGALGLQGTQCHSSAWFRCTKCLADRFRLQSTCR